MEATPERRLQRLESLIGEYGSACFNQGKNTNNQEQKTYREISRLKYELIIKMLKPMTSNYAYKNGNIR